MKGNDLDNIVVPRDVIVFEGLLGLLSNPKDVKAVTKSLKRGKAREAVDRFEINDMMARKILDVTWRYAYEIDALTFFGPEFAEALEERLDREDIPIRQVRSEDPYIFGRKVMTNPRIRFVYYPDSKHNFLFGSKGRYMHPGDYHMLGA